MDEPCRGLCEASPTVHEKPAFSLSPYAYRSPERKHFCKKQSHEKKKPFRETNQLTDVCEITDYPARTIPRLKRRRWSDSCSKNVSNPKKKKITIFTVFRSNSFTQSWTANSCLLLKIGISNSTAYSSEENN